MGQQPSAPKITAQDKAIFQLKQQRDKLKQYQKRLSLVIDRQSQLARDAIRNKQPERAKFYLKAKKQQQATISKTYGQLDNLEGLIGTIEFKLIEKDVIYGLQQGNEVLKLLNSKMSVDKIDKVLDDLEDERLRVDEVSDALGMGSGLTTGEENEVDEEFERLQRELDPQAASKEHSQDKTKDPVLPEVPKDQILPEVPKKTPQQLEPERKAYEPLAE
ncbi:uncharacterized protein CANTADRAFT_3851 [Suhomyces tanzawaensis NRRL Y-17324]|uniref:Snf7-domain-containing protein n=1 Tax=Suhomyces tanzawaensis NRRL Y-17324 TaxID=984487 RepID=A0A1E4SQK6_9ASCO|nr:uncharacterized protein CANTADRAFT_3851 [Suhomyces tanzawaensis NRRL Y-17324]ODV81778.1 hypothetical protein CANTADRAFT_3851 [Suhomyces tanzawaensis NRRL Y-17324]